LLPAWAALGPQAHPAGTSSGPFRVRPPGRQAGRRPRTVVATQPRTAATRPLRHLALQPAPVPTAQPPARGAPHAGLACLVAQRASVAAPARTQPGGLVRHRPATDQPDFGRVARVPASSTVDRAVDGSAATGASTCSGGHGRPATSTWSPTPPPEVGGDGRVRMDGAETRRLDTARVDSRRLDAGRVDSRRPTAGPSGRRPQVTGHRTAGQPDPGRRTRMGGHRMPDTGDRRRGGVLAVSITATMPERWRPAAAPPAGAGWAVYDQERSAARTTRAPRCSGRAWAPPRRLAAGGTPPSSWRLGALLSCVGVGGYEERAMGRRKVRRAGSDWQGSADRW
jgi:hypothetical protein